MKKNYSTLKSPTSKPTRITPSFITKTALRQTLLHAQVFEQKSTLPQTFRRIHRKYLVNYEYVANRFESSVDEKRD
jgi:hypothetical protein